MVDLLTQASTSMESLVPQRAMVTVFPWKIPLLIPTSSTFSPLEVKSSSLLWPFSKKKLIFSATSVSPESMKPCYTPCYMPCSQFTPSTDIFVSCVPLLTLPCRSKARPWYPWTASYILFAHLAKDCLHVNDCIVNQLRSQSVVSTLVVNTQ